MAELWSTLVPLAIATAVLPIQLSMTILMLRSPGGRAKAAAWIAGMSVVRLAQYAVFGAVLEHAAEPADTAPSVVEGALLLIVAVFLLISAGRKLANQPEEDAPPPRWMTMLSGIAPAQAFVMGAALVGLSPKLWAFTLGAIGAVADAHLAPATGWLVFLAWVAAAQALHLVALLAAAVAPRWADVRLARAGATLERNARPLLIGVSLVFGVWFLLKALGAFGLGPLA